MTVTQRVSSKTQKKYIYPIFTYSISKTFLLLTSGENSVNIATNMSYNVVMKVKSIAICVNL